LRLLHLGLPSKRVHYQSVGRRSGESDTFLKSSPVTDTARIPNRDSHTLTSRNKEMLNTFGKRYLWQGGCFVFCAHSQFLGLTIARIIAILFTD